MVSKMNEVGTCVHLVKAIYNFQPTNTDELCFQKGDVITVTQMIDGGWWEGTIHGVTGWFPSNYVCEMKLTTTVDGSTCAKSTSGKFIADAKTNWVDQENLASSNNHLVVLQEIVGSEKKFVTLLEELCTNYLNPLKNNDMLSAAEYTDICSNLVDILSFHNCLLICLEETFKLPVQQQRFGRTFLESASKLQDLYYNFSANHPKTVAVLHSKRNELCQYMEELGAPSPGVMALTTRLSKPFQQIERYSSLLKELERHSEESYADCDDIQRAVVVYREIAISCSEIRRQKEMEYDILHSEINGWDQEDAMRLGEILMLSHIRIQIENGERHERLLLLFPGTLVLLSVNVHFSGYIYEGRMSLSNAIVNNCDETDKNAFEISGGMGIDHLVVICSSSQEKFKWLNSLRRHVRTILATVSVKPVNLQVFTGATGVSTVPVKPGVSVNCLTYNKALPQRVISGRWNISCLRPCAPLRPSVFLKDDSNRSPRTGRRLLGTGRRKFVDDTKVLEEDALILRVIEAYCTSAKSRQTVNSALLENPQVLIAEEEKIIVEELKGDQTVVEEKTLVDTVYSLKDQVRELRQEQLRLRLDLENENQARRHLECLLRQSLKFVVENAGELHDTSSVANI